MKIIEASELPSEEKVYLKKDFLGWRVVSSPLEKFEPSFAWLKRNWFTIIFGTKSNLAFLIVVLIIGVLLYFGINELIAHYKLIADNPCNFCKDCFEQTRNVLASLKSNLTIIKPLNFSM